MCGIAGASWTSNAAGLSVAELRRMTGVLVHRGPDADGVYHSHEPHAGSTAIDFPSGELRDTSQPGAALGHRRLSIIDLAGGSQPLANEDGTVWITYNGEVYNYRELRGQLEQQGHRFRTSSDTETVVHLYEQYGPRCVDHMRGMFAFAIWDENKRQLFLARDRLGKKPLFYRLEVGRLLFASELKALLQVDGAPRELNPSAVDQYLAYQYVPHPGCILQGYNKLPPAHFAVFADGQLDVQRYWSPPYADDTRTEPSTVAALGDTDSWSRERWQGELRERLTEAVRLRMRSDVPLGAFLSGGVDSTIISGLMQKLSPHNVHTFSIGFPVKQFDETSYARAAAAHLGTEHHESVVHPEALKILPKLIWHYDEPFADSSAIPTMYLSEMTRREVTVALSGDGGDELFAGYNRYQAVRVAAMLDRLPGPIKNLLADPIWQRMPSSVRQKSIRRRAKRFFSMLRLSPSMRYLGWIGIFDNDQRYELYTQDFRKRLTGPSAEQFLCDAYNECRGRDFVTQTTCVDLLTYLPCDILTKVDIASMAYSLECRCPFLDHHVVELAARMPIGLKQRGRVGKRILIDTFSDLLPEQIQRRGKMGFGVPLDHWFRGELKELLHDALLDSRSLGRGLFEPAAVRRLVEEHTQSRRDHSSRLWALLCFEMWQRTFLDPATAPRSQPASI